MRTSKKIVSLVLAVMMVVSMMAVGVVSASATDYVAKVGDSYFETLEDAIASISDITIQNNTNYHRTGTTHAFNKYKADGTVTLLADCEGNGFIIDSGSNLTIDFAGCKYSVTGELVGSNSTEYNGFQLLQNSNITFKNGSLYSNKASFLVQNYSNLTLDNMVLSLQGRGTGQYTLSNNCGNVLIKNSTINAPTYSGGYEANEKGSFAFDVCRYSTYPSVSVTVENSTINGDVEVSATGGDVKEGLKLDIQSGTINGEIVDDEAPAAAEVTQDASVIQNVAKIGNTYYSKVTEAFAAAQDGDTIDIIADSAGAGVKVLPNRFKDKGFKVDFHEHTYTIDSTLVGSVGYESQAFHLEQNNKITLQYGTITSENAKMLIQNYCDLTLKSMTLTPNNPTYNNYYTLSNNCGNVVIQNTTINANPTPNSFAFDVCRFQSYPSVNVTVKGSSKIYGDVEISASGSDAKDGFSLTLEGGTMTGEIKLDASAKTAMEKAPAKTEITKKDTFTKEAPEGYKWVSNGAGKSTLEPADLYAQIEGYQKKAEQASADGTGIRILTKVDKSAFEDADKYGYVVAKVSNKAQSTANFANMKANGGNGEKTIDCTGTFNKGITGIDNTYVTLAVNGMSDGDQVAARFFYVKDGVTYYAKYVNVSTYDGIIATYDAD